MVVLNKALYDLHLHLDGSVSFNTARKLAAMQGMQPESDAVLKQRMVVSKDCRDLNEYLTKFDYPLSLLQTKEAISESVYDLLMVLNNQGLSYSEIRFAPQLHTKKGLNQEKVICAAVDGLRRFENEAAKQAYSLKSGFILCCMRGSDNFKENYETLELAQEFLNKGICAIDLAGAEGLYPTKNFRSLLKKAYAMKLPMTIHAGEADGPKSIWDAIECGAKRIGHGVRCVEDKVLMKRLLEDGIALELCPTSNLQTRIFKDITEYPIRKLLDAGIRVTINTDNMTVSNVTVQSELQMIENVFAFSENEMKLILENSRYAAFEKI